MQVFNEDLLPPGMLLKTSSPCRNHDTPIASLTYFITAHLKKRNPKKSCFKMVLLANPTTFAILSSVEPYTMKNLLIPQDRKEARVAKALCAIVRSATL